MAHTRLKEEQLRMLTTPRLLTYYKKHYRAEHTGGYAEEDLAEWQIARRNHRRLVRRILNEREHVEA